MEIYPKKSIRIGSKAELDKEMRRVQRLFKKGETEETWELINLALKNMSVWTVEDKAYEYEGFVEHLKILQRPLIKILTTERTRLMGTATDFLKSLSQAMQRDYEVHVHDLFAPTLLRMFARTNKVMLTRTLECYKTIIDHAKLPKMIPKFAILLKSKKEPSKSVRQCIAACLDKLIDINAQDNTITEEQQELIEDAIRTTAMDSAPEVRLAIRCCYKTYCTKFPASVSEFEDKLPADIKKYLNASSKPSKLTRTNSRSSLSSITSSTSSSSKPNNTITEAKTNTIKTTTTTTKMMTGSLSSNRVSKNFTRPASKSRYSAPQLSTVKLPAVQRPNSSVSASLSTKKPEMPNNMKNGSILLSKPASASTRTRKVGSAIQNNSSSIKTSGGLAQLMRATTSSSQKLKPKSNDKGTVNGRRPIQKTFTLGGMKPVRPVMKRLASSIPNGVENKHPAKKQKIGEEATT
ncbi:hypothetical protein INT45_007198 [Circinella minor]|uniref:CLASP N-terminal domain-containing protein n=1 Tax=Circinella minor TaxID=1195481 RepID=A0A8H7S5X9_9FUNG|nr:hypothetical protein INT45_007198 [Circinella minor]